MTSKLSLLALGGLFLATSGCALGTDSESSDDRETDVGELQAGLEAQCTTDCPAFTTGIYALSFGKSLATDANLKKALGSPNVTGIVIRVPWSKLQPTQPSGGTAVYDWSYLEQELDLVPAGKKVGLAITPGNKSPSWFCGAAYPSECRTFEYSPGGPLGGQTITVPRPFSAPFKTLYGNMIKALGARLQSNAARYAKIAYVKLNGVNMTTDETMLPLKDAHGTTIDWGVASPTTAAIDTFKFFAAKWASSFGKKRLSLSTGAHLELDTPLADWMKQTYETRGIVQQNGLKNGANLAGTVTKAMSGDPHTLGGWQPWGSIELEGCVMQGAKACEPTSGCTASNHHKVFRGMVKFGLGLCAGQTTAPGSFFEMYVEDLVAYDKVQADGINYVQSSQALVKANGPTN